MVYAGLDLHKGAIDYSRVNPSTRVLNSWLVILAIDRLVESRRYAQP